MTPSLLWTAAAAATAFLVPLAAPSPSEVHAPVRPAAEPIDYQTQVRPILSARCFACHGPDEEAREADLRLDQRDDAVRLREDEYRVITPGEAGESELVWRVTDDSDPMPPEETGHRLSEAEVATLKQWIDEGAEYTPHWSFEPISSPTAPTFEDEAARRFVRSPIDAFVLRRLRENGLEPSTEADRHTLIRRLSLDLIGLPPTPEEIEAFVTDDSPEAYDQLVDRLLASSAYGERWASVWLDIARYADSAGYGSDPLRQIWRYRDWVIDAFNRDLPYDEFTVQQMAGDLMPEATTETRLATAFHRNTLTNTEGGTVDEEFRVIAVKDRINVSMQAWMGLTFGCAQCHTHKFDPITHNEYYSAFALFNQTADSDRPNEHPRLETPTAEQLEFLAGFDQRIKDLESEIEKRLQDEDALDRFAQQVVAPQEGWVDSNPNRSAELGGSTQRFTFDLDNASVAALRVTSPARQKSAVSFADVELRHRVREARAASFVRVSLPGDKRILSLAEVEVFVDGQNVAPEGTAQQSSTAYGGPPGFANDGNTDGEFEKRTTTHTATESNPWWELALKEPVSIDAVHAWPRTDGNLHTRSNGLRIELLDADRKPIASHTQRTAPKTAVEWSLAEGGVVAVDFLRAALDRTNDAQARWTDGRADTKLPLIDRGRMPQAIQIELLGALSGGELELRLVGGEAGADDGPLTQLRWQTHPESPAPTLYPVGVVDAASRPRIQRREAHLARLRTVFAEADKEIFLLKQKQQQIDRKKQELKVPTTPVLEELPKNRQRKTFVLSKGNYLAPTHQVKPGVPAAFGWGDAPVTDRLAFARWLVHKDNPLTPRVAVNRLWARLFGTGLVLTEEDFGAQGSTPTHPELLDWLADSFRSHWSQKELLRTIVRSSTYRQSSRVSERTLEVDPDNVLLSRGARFRLPAEAVRDQALAVSGLLSRTMYGPSVFPPQPDGLWQAAFNGQRNWRTDTGENRWRRGLYVFWRRSTPYPSMMVFDAPSRETCTLRRIETNSPLQAFVTLNDPVYVEAAQAFARRLLTLDVGEVEDPDRARIEHGLVLTLGRPAAPRAVDVLAELVREQRALFAERKNEAVSLATDPLGPLPDSLDAAETAAWTVVANVLLNQNAFLTRD